MEKKEDMQRSCVHTRQEPTTEVPTMRLTEDEVVAMNAIAVMKEGRNIGNIASSSCTPVAEAMARLFEEFPKVAHVDARNDTAPTLVPTQKGEDVEIVDVCCLPLEARSNDEVVAMNVYAITKEGRSIEKITCRNEQVMQAVEKLFEECPKAVRVEVRDDIDNELVYTHEREKVEVADVCRIPLEDMASISSFLLLAAFGDNREDYHRFFELLSDAVDIRSSEDERILKRFLEVFNPKG